MRNFFHLSLNQGVNVVVALLITPYLFQTLGEAEYGLVSVALTVVLLCGMMVNYGFNLNTPQKLTLIRNDVNAKEILINEVIFTRVFLSVVLAILLLVCTNYLGLFEGYSAILAFSVIQLFNDALFPMFILQGFDRLSWIAKANAISKLMYLALVILVVHSVADAKWVNFLLGSTGALIHGFLLIKVYQSESIRLRWVAFERIRHWLWHNFQFFSSTIASYILINGGFILLKNFVTDAELGFYALAQRVAVLLRMVPVFVTQSIIQKASRLHEKDKDKFESYLFQASKIGILITLATGLIVATFSKWIVRVLAGEFIPLSAELMAILGFLPFLSMLNVPNMIRILVKEQKYVLSKAIWITTTFMLVLSIVGSYFYGSYGLSVALLISELINYFVHRWILNRARRTSHIT
ncbi:oligosaccharide flippase family protein [Roseivirga sp. E12]|uniref:oligosaccharide flippase family protein n=1 Tax=Roseivirga sp. E12 TaxID=2819237 RepID=UPI001ABC885E|nr:oligosaccharide flippase family protein [Roseivirga sp. E12]MBO3699738.1 oligosaccharide flippase family protein [Roseivirga sp. E12]